MKNTVYVVTADGYPHDDYGEEIYLIGVFDKSYVAEAVKAKYPDLDVTITEVEMGKEYPLNQIDFGLFENDKYLGGYAE